MTVGWIERKWNRNDRPKIGKAAPIVLDLFLICESCVVLLLGVFFCLSSSYIRMCDGDGGWTSAVWLFPAKEMPLPGSSSFGGTPGRGKKGDHVQ
jgi:hypothetical protein